MMAFHDADQRYRHNTAGKRYPIFPEFSYDPNTKLFQGYYYKKEELKEYRKSNPICPKDDSHGQMRLHVAIPKGVGVYECVYGCTHPGCEENLRETIILH